jgi:hypothetical protein
VEWRERKTGVYYPQEKSARTASSRGVIAGQTRHRLAGRSGGIWPVLALGGFARRAGPAQSSSLPMDPPGSGMWRRTAGKARPNCSHASEHLGSLGRALNGDDEAAAARSADRFVINCDMKAKKGLAKIAVLPVLKGKVGRVVLREQNYFATHADRMNYQSIHRRGWTSGAETVESAGASGSANSNARNRSGLAEACATSALLPRPDIITTRITINRRPCQDAPKSIHNPMRTSGSRLTYALKLYHYWNVFRKGQLPKL